MTSLQTFMEQCRDQFGTINPDTGVLEGPFDPATEIVVTSPRADVLVLDHVGVDVRFGPFVKYGTRHAPFSTAVDPPEQPTTR